MRFQRIELVFIGLMLAVPAYADCSPPDQPGETKRAVETYLRAADAYLTCLQKSDTPDTPPLIRKAHADAMATTYKAMQKAADEYNSVSK